MTATSHAILGALIAAKITNPYLAVPLALASHIVGDAIPHWDCGTGEPKKARKKVMHEAFFDVAIGFIISFALLFLFFPKTDPFYAFFIILVSQSLDWITAPYYFFKVKEIPFFWAYKLQKKFDNNTTSPWGVINQIGLVSLAFVLSFLF